LHDDFGPLRRAALALVAAAMLAGCAAAGTEVPPTPTTTLPAPTARPVTPVPTEAPTSMSGLQGTVSVWVAWEADRVADLSSLLQGFHEQNPGVNIRLTYITPDQLLPAYRAAVPAGQAPSVLIGPSAWGAALQRDGLILDVGSRLLPTLREEIVERLWSQVTVGGAIIGLPVRARGIVLLRNRNLAPQPAADLASLLQQAEQTSVRFAAEPVFDLGFDFASAQLTPCGGTVLRTGGGLGFNEQVGLCWLTLLARFRQAGPLTFNTDADRSTFLAGHSPWLIDTTDALPEIISAMGAENLSVDAWPVIDPGGESLSGTVWTDNAYFTAGSSAADLEASWSFVNLLVSPEGQRRLTQAAGSWFLPVSRSVQPLDPLAATASSLLAGSTGLPLAANLDLYRVALERAVNSVAAQAGDPAAALRRATEVITNQLTQSPPGG
jgi:ABC-type glycerol-3-phosphate transport system substrate-binding protein